MGDRALRPRPAARPRHRGAGPQGRHERAADPPLSSPSWPSPRSTRPRSPSTVPSHDRLARGSRASTTPCSWSGRTSSPTSSAWKRARAGARPRTARASRRARGSTAAGSTPCWRDSTGPIGSRSSRSCRCRSSSSDIRARVAAGGSIEGLVPSSVAAEVARLGCTGPLTVQRPGVCLRRPDRRDDTDLTSLQHRTPYRRPLRGEAGDRRGDPRHAVGVRLHRLLRDRDREESPGRRRRSTTKVRARAEARRRG